MLCYYTCTHWHIDTRSMLASWPSFSLRIFSSWSTAQVTLRIRENRSVVVDLCLLLPWNVDANRKRRMVKLRFEVFRLQWQTRGFSEITNGSKMHCGSIYHRTQFSCTNRHVALFCQRHSWAACVIFPPLVFPAKRLYQGICSQISAWSQNTHLGLRASLWCASCFSVFVLTQAKQHYSVNPDITRCSAVSMCVWLAETPQRRTRSI